MTRANRFLATAGSFVVALGVLAVITAPLPAKGEEAARQFEQTYCFIAKGGDRWKGCR